IIGKRESGRADTPRPRRYSRSVFPVNLNQRIDRSSATISTHKAPRMRRVGGLIWPAAPQEPRDIRSRRVYRPRGGLDIEVEVVLERCGTLVVRGQLVLFLEARPLLQEIAGEDFTLEEELIVL